MRAGDYGQVQVLLSILADEKSNGRTHAAESLFKVGHNGDQKVLKAAFDQDKDLKLKLMAAAALASGGDKATLDEIRRYLKHDDVEVRKVAVWILGQIGAASDAKSIEAVLSRESDELARSYCANALACLGNDDGKHLLSENLKSANPAVRTYSADFAGHAGLHEVRDRLIDLLDDEAVDVRVRAAQALFMLAGVSGQARGSGRP